MSDDSPAGLEFGSDLLPTEFWANVKAHRTGCWRWIGNVEKSGYARFRNVPIHRLTYSKIMAIPEGYVVDHLCHDPKKCKLGRQCPHRRCCNPEHLEAVTNEENVRRGNWHLTKADGLQSEGFAQCPKGHWRTSGKGCYECVKERKEAVNRQRSERLEAFRNRWMPTY